MSTQRKFLSPFVVSFFITLGVFLIANDLHRLDDCDDCFRPHGVPFPYYHEGGFGGGAGISWFGLIGDALIVFLVAKALAFTWQRLVRRKGSI